MFVSYCEVKKETKSLKMDQIVYISYCGHSVVTMDNNAGKLPNLNTFVPNVTIKCLQ